jgi:membrane protease YdiL (CAAX protease family)
MQTFAPPLSSRTHDAPPPQPLAFGRATAVHSWRRRLGEAAALVALYVLLGSALRLDANAYLVLGVPLALAFQRLVARAPLRAAWVRDGEPFHFGRRLVVRAILFSLAPLLSIVDVIHLRSWSSGAAVVAGVAGAFGLAYARGAVPRGELGKRLRGAAIAAVPGIVVLGGYALLHRETLHVQLPTWGVAAVVGVFSFAQYVPVCFAVEEVLFRGVLDSYVARESDGPKARAATAVALSALWGLWHLPLVLKAGMGAPEIASMVGLMLLVHVVAGLALTAAWRWKGTLLVPAVAHALVDAVRNALM